MFGVIRSELTKVLTLPSVWFITGALIALGLFFQYQINGFYIEMAGNVRPDGLVNVDGRLVSAEEEIREDFVASVFNPGIVFFVLGAVVAGAEFRTGQLGVSMLAVPDRTRLVLGKVIATTLYALALGVVFVLIGAAFVYAAVRDWNPGMVWGPDTLIASGRILLFLVALTLIPFGITLIMRRTLSGIIMMVVLTMLTITQVVALVSPAVDAFMPLSATRNLLLQGAGNPVPLTASAGHGAMVLLGWSVLTVIVATVVIGRRDAR